MKNRSDIEPALDHRRQIRQEELRAASQYVWPGETVLEIGAGAGWQAQLLEQIGCTVIAVDIPSSNYNRVRVWPVFPYDGRHLPLRDSCVDVIFSSNVLEHVPHIGEFQTEMLRVLRPGGRAIHILPTSTWRFWTILSRFPDLLKKLFSKIFRRFSPSQRVATSAEELIAKGPVPLPKRLVRLVIPIRHGERGNVLTEMYYFSRQYWIALFLRTGWNLDTVLPNRLFYTGHRVLGSTLSLPLRRVLSRLFGSSCSIYVLTKPESRSYEARAVHE